MKLIESIIATTHLNRRFEKFTLSALESIAQQINKSGQPVLVKHDWSRPLGWSYAAEVHELEDGESGVVTTSFLAETDSERAEISRLCHNFYTSMADEKIKSNTALIEAASSAVTEHKVGADLQCCYLTSPDIVVTRYPELRNLLDDDGLVQLNGETRLISNRKRGCTFPFIPYQQHLLVPHWLLKRRCCWMNSYNTDLIDCVCQFASEHRDLSVRLRVDPNTLGIPGTASRYQELDFWWGPGFSGDLLTMSDGVTRHGSSPEEIDKSGVQWTDFWVHTHGSEKVFEIEQIDHSPIALQVEKGNAYRPASYMHTVIDKAADTFHFDGAYRLYTEQQWTERQNTDLRKAGKIAIREKAFRVDGPMQSFQQQEWVRFLHHFFRGNPHPAEYFGYELADPLYGNPKRQ